MKVQRNISFKFLVAMHQKWLAISFAPFELLEIFRETWLDTSFAGINSDDSYIACKFSSHQLNSDINYKWPFDRFRITAQRNKPTNDILQHELWPVIYYYAKSISSEKLFWCSRHWACFQLNWDGSAKETNIKKETVEFIK